MSYRRGDTSGYAGHLYRRLSSFFDPAYLFMDIKIPPGADFVERIEQGVGSCDVLLAIIGQEWLDVKGTDGKRRLDDPQDYTRLEIEAGLQRGVAVIPVLVAGAVMPIPRELPSSLAGVSRRMALEIRDVSFDFDTERLVEAIEGYAKGRIPRPKSPPPPADPPADPRPPADPPPSETKRQPTVITVDEEQADDFEVRPRRTPIDTPDLPPIRPGTGPAQTVIDLPVAESRHATAARAAAPAGRAPAPVMADRTKSFRIWGWILATVGALLVPVLAVIAVVLGCLIIARGDGHRTGTGVAIIIVAIICGVIGVGIWVG